MFARPARRTRLTVEPLEARETPTAGPWIAESFDTTTAGSVPIGWTTWGANGQPGWNVAGIPAASGQSFAVSGGSSLTAGARLGATQPADVAATTAVLANSLIPAQILVRGRGLGTAKPTYYSASVVRGLEVRLLRVDGGSTTELANLKSLSYLSGVWVDFSLIAKSDRLQVRVQRRDTGEWLNQFGGWQSSPAAALDARDAAISGPGYVGLVRTTSHAGTIYADDFRVGPAAGDIRPPVTTAAIDGLEPSLRVGTVAGQVRLHAAVRDASRIDRVEFFVDGTLVGRRTAAPFQQDFDTHNLPNGTHTFAVRAWDAAGNVGEAKTSFVAFNRATISLPALARHYSHIRYAALAYSGSTIGPEEEKLLRESVDLVAP